MACEGEVGVTFDELRPECNAFVFQNKAHAEHVLTGCTNMNGEEVLDSLRERPSALSSAKGGRNFTKRREIFPMMCVHQTQWDWAYGLLDAKRSTEATLSVDLTLSSIFWGTRSRQDALHTWILEAWSSRLTDLMAAEIRTSEPLMRWGLMYKYQSSRWAKSLAPSSSSRWEEPTSSFFHRQVLINLLEHGSAANDTTLCNTLQEAFLRSELDNPHNFFRDLWFGNVDNPLECLHTNVIFVTEYTGCIFGCRQTSYL